MARLRRVLAPLTALWLFCQVATLASVPLVLSSTATDPHEAECTCAHEAAVMCPMHHKPAGRSVPCAMQAANSSGPALSMTLVGVAGCLSEATLGIGPAEPSMRLLRRAVRIVGERPVPPDPPPPRI